MTPLILPPGHYSIRPHGNQIEIEALERELTREEVASYLERTPRSIDLYRALPPGNPRRLASRREGGRIFIKQSELSRWLLTEGNLNDTEISRRPRPKRRARLVIQQQSENRSLAEATA